jgi:ATP-binding cassette subfamily B protein
LSARKERAAFDAAAAARAASEVDAAELEKERIDLRATASRVARLATPEAGLIGFSVATLGVTTAISLIFPFALGEILDASLSVAEGSAGASGWTPNQIAAGLLGLFGVQGGLIVARTAALSVAGEWVVARLRLRVFAALLEQEIAFFDRQRTGELMNRLSSDAQMVQRAVTNNATQGVRSLSMVLGGTGMLFYVSPSLAMLSLTVTPTVALGARHTGKFLKRKQAEVQDALAASAARAEEALGAVRTVRHFAAEGDEVRRYSAQVKRAFDGAVEAGLAQAWFEGGVHFAANTSMVAVLAYGGSQVLAGELTAGALTSFLMYSLYVGFNVSGLGNVYTDFMKAAGASSRLFAILDRVPAMPGAVEGEGAAPRFRGRTWLEAAPRPSAGAAGGALRTAGVGGVDVSLEAVRFAYPLRPRVRILDGVDLDIPAGSHVALVGGSGCGKSTVAAMLARLYDPDEGRVRIGGVDVSAFPGGPAALRRSVGVVPQDPSLFSCSIADNIRYGRPDASDEAVRAAAEAASALAFAEALPDGLDTLVGERGVRLSGGQKQRIALARALLTDPPLIVLDEATSALDAESEFQVQRAVERICRGDGQGRKTVVSIAHRLSTMRSADRIAVMQGGRIVETGTFDELVSSDAGSVFRKLVRRQLAGSVDPARHARGSS